LHGRLAPRLDSRLGGRISDHHDSLDAGLLLGREFAHYGAASRDALLAHPLDFVRQGRPKSGTQLVDSLDDVAVSSTEFARHSLQVKRLGG